MAVPMPEIETPRRMEDAGESSLDLPQMLQLVADTIVDCLGFAVAAINIVDGDTESMVIAAVSGPDEMREALLNQRQGLVGWALLIEASEPWGRLRFLDHVSSNTDPDGILSWTPNLPVSTDPNAWHPEDSLFAMLESSAGELLGILSVDCPRDGLRPGPMRRRALEAFAVSASLAIQHAKLAIRHAEMAGRSRRDARRFQAVFDSSPVAIGLLGPDDRLSMVNDAFCGFLGRERQLLLGHDPAEFAHPDDHRVGQSEAMLVRSSLSALRGARPAAVEKRYLLPDGSIVWGRLHVASLDTLDESGSIIAQLEDITERKRTEELLLQQAHFDALTSLPNRAYSMRRLREDLRADEAAGTLTVVFFCDLDGLKLVNDTYGHAVGDAYIRAVGHRIRTSVRDGDAVGRLSGDEFVVIVHGGQAHSEVIALASRLLEAVGQPLRLGDVIFEPSLSVGIAYSAGAATTADDLLARADAAMYQAKDRNRGGWVVYQHGAADGNGPPDRRTRPPDDERDFPVMAASGDLPA